jgi:hypothetical protein
MRAARAESVGWVFDQATSTRSIHVTRTPEGLVRLTVEVSGQPSLVVELDEEGVAILQGYLRASSKTRAESLPARDVHRPRA